MSTVHPPDTNNEFVTSWIPLTTHWSSTIDCAGEYMLDTEKMALGGEIPTASSLIAFNPDFGISVLPGLKCHPDEITTSWNRDGDSNGNLHPVIYNEPSSKLTLVSLLPITCPDAWSTVATFVKSSISTQVMCCPPSYVLLNSIFFSIGVEGECVSMVSSDTNLNYYEFARETVSATSESAFYFVSSTYVGDDFPVRAIPILGWNVQSTAPTIGNTVTSFPTQTPSSLTANGSFSVENGIKSDGLSNGTKAGIGVATAISTFIIIALIAWIVILRRKARNISAKTEVSDQPTDSNGQSDSNPLCELDDLQIINELHHTNLCELHSVSTPAELTEGPE